MINIFYNHIAFEAYCTKDDELECSLKNKRICVDCFASNCQYLSYTEAPHEVLISDKDGISLYDIGFGGDMETTEEKREENIKLWEKICKLKINEAYADYIKEKNE
jgi:translation elongation factor EF-Ts